MKILLVTYYGLKGGGGIATATQMLAQKWLTAGDEVAITSFGKYQFANSHQLPKTSLNQKKILKSSPTQWSSSQKTSLKNSPSSSFQLSSSQKTSPKNPPSSNFHWYRLPNVRLCPNFARREEILIRHLSKILTDFQPDIVEATDLRFVGSATISAVKNFNETDRLPRHLPPIKVFTDYRDYWFACPKGDLLFQNHTPCSGMEINQCLRCLQGQNPPCWIRQKYNFIQNRRSILNLADQKLVVSQSVLEVMKKNHLDPNATVVYDTILDPPAFCSLTSHDSSQSETTSPSLSPSSSPSPSQFHSKSTSPSPSSNTFSSSHPAEILFVGKLIYHRGIKLILELANLAQLQNLPLRFTLIGDGPLRTHILRQIRQLHLVNLTLTGALPPSALPNYYHSADLVIFPTQIQEPFSRSVLEALFAHKIVLASNLGGLKEIIVSDKNGWLLPPADPQAWLDKINFYCASSQTRLRLQKSAQKILDTNSLFQPDNYFAKIKKIYTNPNGKKKNRSVSATT